MEFFWSRLSSGPCNLRRGNQYPECRRYLPKDRSFSKSLMELNQGPGILSPLQETSGPPFWNSWRGKTKTRLQVSASGGWADQVWIPVFWAGFRKYE